MLLRIDALLYNTDEAAVAAAAPSSTAAAASAPCKQGRPGCQGAAAANDAAHRLPRTGRQFNSRCANASRCLDC